MPALDCSVKTCYNNKENNCCLNSISVEGSEAHKSELTSCASFRKKPENGFINSVTNENPKTHLDIACQAKQCSFNNNYKCDASHIGIAGHGAEHIYDTQCSSFYKQ